MTRGVPVSMANPASLGVLSMRKLICSCLGYGVALWFAAPGRADDPRPNDNPGRTPAVQPDRSRGFFGFPDWDSRAGGYDRARRVADDEPNPADRRGQDNRRGSDDGRGGPGSRGG